MTCSPSRAPDLTATAPGGVALACAMPIEARALARHAGAGAHIDCGGVGPERAEIQAERILRARPRAIIAAGFCGALDPGLALGDVLACEEVVDGRDGCRFAADPALLGASRGRRAVLLTVDRPARTAAERRALAGGAVDMESAVLARAAARAGVPFLALRAVSDTAVATLPDVGRLVDADGRPRPAAVASLAIRDPLALLRLGRGGRAAARALGESVRALLAEIA